MGGRFLHSLRTHAVTSTSGQQKTFLRVPAPRSKCLESQHCGTWLLRVCHTITLVNSRRHQCHMAFSRHMALRDWHAVASENRKNTEGSIYPTIFTSKPYTRPHIQSLDCHVLGKSFSSMY